MYRDQGLLIFCFPCNQFFQQEKRPNNEIKDYVKDLYNVEFLLFGKVEVNGKDCHPVYKFLRTNSSLNEGAKGIREIPWNFSKFLVDRSGKVVGYYEPTVKPSKISQKIEELLKN